MDVERICAEYLRSVSPLAQRIAEDIDSVRIAYKDLWEALDIKDRNQVVDEALIDPAAVVKYANENKENNCTLEPLSNFSWFTQSQLNLFKYLPSHVICSRPNRTTSMKSMDTIKSPSNKIRFTSPPQIQREIMSKAINVKSPKDRNKSHLLKKSLNEVSIQDNKINIDHNIMNKSNENVQKMTTIIAKPKNPPPPPPPQKCAKFETKSALQEQDDIPKTGFDFLDNW